MCSAPERAAKPPLFIVLNAAPEAIAFDAADRFPNAASGSKALNTAAHAQKPRALPAGARLTVCRTTRVLVFSGAAPPAA